MITQYNSIFETLSSYNEPADIYIVWKSKGKGI